MTPATAGPFAVVALLLAVAGAAKVLHPAGTARALRAAGLPSSPPLAQGLGVVEVLVGLAAVVIGSRPLALLVVAAYLGFAGFTIRLIARSEGHADCGCFGDDAAPATSWHVVGNLAAAAVAALAAVSPPGSLAGVLGDQPVVAVPFVVFVGVAIWAAQVAFTLLPTLGVAVAEGHDEGRGERNVGGTGGGRRAPRRPARR